MEKLKSIKIPSYIFGTDSIAYSQEIEIGNMSFRKKSEKEKEKFKKQPKEKGEIFEHNIKLKVGYDDVSLERDPNTQLCFSNEKSLTEADDLIKFKKKLTCEQFMNKFLTKAAKRVNKPIFGHFEEFFQAKQTYDAAVIEIKHTFIKTEIEKHWVTLNGVLYEFKYFQNYMAYYLLRLFRVGTAYDKLNDVDSLFVLLYNSECESAWNDKKVSDELQKELLSACTNEEEKSYVKKMMAKTVLVYVGPHREEYLLQS
jgi:hypothetical protein